MCNTCKRIVDHKVFYKDGASVWLHSMQDLQDADHVVDPVPVDPAVVRARCDLCNAEVVSAQAWTLPCNDFIQVILDGNVHWSRGDFACCEDCAELIGGERWGRLELRMLKQFERRHGSIDLNIALAMTDHLDKTRAAMKGPPYLESAL